MKKIIITGSSGSGKSTLLNALSRDFSVAEEVSRSVITEQQKLKTDISPWGDVEKFAEISLKKMIQQYEQQEANYCIYDRAIPDLIALLRFRKKEVSRCYYDQVNQHLKGSLIIFAPPWEKIYISDPQRPENYRQTLPMSILLKNVYQELGFTLVDLPKASIASRVDFVQDLIQ